MPILFMVCGVLFLFELIVGLKYSHSKKDHVLLSVQLLLILISYFTKPVGITSNLGIQLPAVIALLLGVRFTKRNTIPTIAGVLLFLFVYLLSSLYNYELLSMMSDHYYYVLLGVTCLVTMNYKNLCGNLLSLIPVISFVVDFSLLSNVGGYVVIGTTSLASFSIVIHYAVVFIEKMIESRTRETKYEKVV